MKIAYISSAFLADCDLPLLHEMHKDGHEVHYFLQMSDSSRQATVINVPQMKPEGGLFSATEYPALAHLAQYLPLENIYVVNMPKARDWAYSSLKAVWKLYRFLKKGGFDVIHITSPLRYGTFLLYGLRRKMVLTMHDPLPHSSDMRRLNRFHRWVAFRSVRDIIILSASLKDEFARKCHVDSQNIHMSRFGIYNILHNVEPAKMDLPKKYILYAGSINPHKGIKFLCEAMRLISRKHPDLSLVIAGRGAFDFDIEAYMKDCPIQLINRFVTDGELVTLMKNSSLVVCPYIDATQSGVIMSSFALDKPVIATNVGALGEMFTDGVHGLLVEAKSGDAIAEAVDKMMQPGVLERMTASIVSDYATGPRSWTSIASETIDIYQKVIEAK